MTEPRLEQRVLRAIAGESTSVVLFFDAASVIRWANAGVERVTGFTPEQVVGRTVQDFVHPDDRSILAESLAFEAENPWNSELGLPPAGRELFQLRVPHARLGWVTTEVIVSNRLADPAVRGFIALLRDVTHRRRLGTTLSLLGAGAPANQVLAAVVAQASDEVRSPNAVALIVNDRHPVIGDQPVPGISRDGAGEGPWRVAMETGRTVVIERPEQLGHSLSERAVAAGMFSCWCTPIASPSGAEVFGSLVVWSGYHGPPTPGERRSMHRTAQLAALAVERERREASLRWAATHDPLTRVANRRAFDARIEELCTGRALLGWALLVVDLDRFKEHNDKLGHHVGDRLLVETANRIRDAVRPDDLVARVGGDEFTVLCSEIGRERDTDVIADRLVRSLSETMEIDGNTVSPAGSVGVVVCSGVLDPDVALRKADTALYQAKAAGRGGWSRVSLHGDPPEMGDHSIDLSTGRLGRGQRP